MDKNGNGYVEFDELVHVLIPRDSSVFDRDGNGFITAAELAGSMARMGQPLTYRELAAMMAQADSNGDGVISFEEFVNILAKSAADFLGIKVA
ncbi:probable calcium-binding protein CML16 [Arachis duranensis]|nr:probable calcium-binding protein CML16 [Arachis duranensis]